MVAGVLSATTRNCAQASAIARKFFALKTFDKNPKKSRKRKTEGRNQRAEDRGQTTKQKAKNRKLNWREEGGGWRAGSTPFSAVTR